jgi:transcriptional regulator with XRE-family HTH domain
VENVQPHFGVRLRMLRLRRGLSQFDLSELAEVSEEQLSKIERGKSWTGEVTCALLARALAVPLVSLFDFSENEAFIEAGGLKRRLPRRSRKIPRRSSLS